jgi:hypothetical protein
MDELEEFINSSAPKKVSSFKSENSSMLEKLDKVIGIPESLN